MNLNEKYLPEFQFSERHVLRIAASRAAVMAEVLRYRPENDALFRGAIAARELPMRLRNVFRRQENGQPAFGMDNFSVLEQAGDQEVAFGLLGKFWQLDYGQSPIEDAQDFLDYREPGAAKLLLSFKADELDAGDTQLTTETRVFCVDQSALRRFTPYWYLIRPVSGLIRRRILASIGQSAVRLSSSSA